MALHRKWEPLLALQPDIAVIQECASPTVMEAKIPALTSEKFLWAGSQQHKGLAIIAFGGWQIEPYPIVMANADYFLPANVRGPVLFSLLGVWAKHRPIDKLKNSVGPLNRALDLLEGFINRGNVIVAGDFNHNVRWDRPGKLSNHTSSVERLAAYQLKSAYHAALSIEQGQEIDPTIYWRDRTRNGPSYHIDYVFVPSALPTDQFSVTVGRYDDWVQSKLSDHVPIVLDVDDDALSGCRQQA